MLDWGGLSIQGTHVSRAHKDIIMNSHGFGEGPIKTVTVMICYCMLHVFCNLLGISTANIKSQLELNCFILLCSALLVS